MYLVLFACSRKQIDNNIVHKVVEIMKLSVVTPCYNSADYIERCIKSVSDQQGVDVEHIIQDGGSTDGTINILKNYADISVITESDTGMYDAINKGFNRATGDIFSHINSDEQYLPQVLRIVATFFENHPDIDILFTNVLVLQDDASFVCFQKVIKPTKTQTLLSHLSTYTAGTFFRRRVWEDGIHFDTSKKALGDSWWILDILKAKYKTAHKNQYTTIVTATEKNLSLSDIARQESRELFETAGSFPRIQWMLQFIYYRMYKLINGCYYQKPFSYSVYTKNNTQDRQTFNVTKPSPFWMQMHKLKSLDYYANK